MGEMGKLGKSDVNHVAKLASFKLTSDEVTKFADQLSEVISYFEELNEVDTSSVEPTSQTTGIKNVSRQDKLGKESLSQEEAISGTERVHNSYFVVPMILEERSDY